MAKFLYTACLFAVYQCAPIANNQPLIRDSEIYDGLDLVQDLGLETLAVDDSQKLKSDSASSVQKASISRENLVDLEVFSDYDTVQDTLVGQHAFKVKAEQAVNAGKPSISQENLVNLEVFNDYDTVLDTLVGQQATKAKASIDEPSLENLELFNDYDAVRMSQAQMSRDRRQHSESEHHIQSPQIEMEILDAADYDTLVGQTHDSGKVKLDLQDADIPKASIKRAKMVHDILAYDNVEAQPLSMD